MRVSTARITKSRTRLTIITHSIFRPSLVFEKNLILHYTILTRRMLPVFDYIDFTIFCALYLSAVRLFLYNILYMRTRRECEREGGKLSTKKRTTSTGEIVRFLFYIILFISHLQEELFPFNRSAGLRSQIVQHAVYVCYFRGDSIGDFL